MADLRTVAELTAALRDLAAATGGTVTEPDDHTITGQSDVILSKWFLGSRKVAYRFRCLLDVATHRVTFRESSSEVVWGMPPPTFTVERTDQAGTHVTTHRTDSSLAGGGGTLEVGDLRAAIEAAVQQAGWTFVFEPLGRP